jgi:hypothetical protein
MPREFNATARRSSRLYLCLLLLPWQLCFGGDMGNTNCDPGLQPAGGSTVGYAARGDRCEGLYVQEVSGGALEIVSLTQKFEPYRFEADKPLVLDWQAFGDAPVQVRACGVKPKLYYRMDTTHVQKPSSYLWPADILSRLELQRDEIGLLAWTQQPVGKEMRKVFLPLRTALPGATTTTLEEDTSDSYKVVLLSSVELQEMYVTLRPLDSKGKPGAPIRDNQKVGSGYYPANRPLYFHISFSELAGAPDGLYLLRVGAELRTGDPRGTDLCFFHSPPARGGGKQ